MIEQVCDSFKAKPRRKGTAKYHYLAYRRRPRAQSSHAAEGARVLLPAQPTLCCIHSLFRQPLPMLTSRAAAAPRARWAKKLMRATGPTPPCRRLKPPRPPSILMTQHRLMRNQVQCAHSPAAYAIAAPAYTPFNSVSQSIFAAPE